MTGPHPRFSTRVYFLRPVGQNGPIKIGSSENPLSRLNAYRTWSPIPLELVAHAKASCNTEMFLHRFFLDDWMHGEWFAWSVALQGLIDHVSHHDAWPDWVSPPTNPNEYRQFKERFPKGKGRLTVASIFPQDSAA